MPNMEIILRPAVPEDAPVLADIQIQAWNAAFGGILWICCHQPGKRNLGCQGFAVHHFLVRRNVDADCLYHFSCGEKPAFR